MARVKAPLVLVDHIAVIDARAAVAALLLRDEAEFYVVVGRCECGAFAHMRANLADARDVAHASECVTGRAYAEASALKPLFLMPLAPWKGDKRC